MTTQRTTPYPELFQVLGDPNRLAIFNLLMQGVQCNCELGDRLHMPMNLISHHLKVLRAAGLVNAERDTRDARWVYYAIDQRTLEQQRTQLAAFLDPQRIQPRQPACGPRAAVRKTTVIRRARRRPVAH